MVDDGAAMFSKILYMLEELLEWVAMIAIALVVVFVAIDLVFRLVLSKPFVLEFEVSEIYLMPILCLLPISSVYRNRGHLSIDVYKFEKHAKSWLLVRKCTQVLMALFVGLVSSASFGFFLDAYARNEIYMGVYNWPLDIAYLVVPVAFFVLFLRICFELATDWKR